MVERCSLGMVSSSARHPIVPLANAKVQPGKASAVKPHVEPIHQPGRDPLAIQKGETWHENL